MTMEPFNPSDPFDAATEAVRKDIADVIYRHWSEAEKSSALDQNVIMQAILTALTVSLAFTLKSVASAPDSHLIEMVRASLPSAFATAAGIIADEDPREVRH